MPQGNFDVAYVAKLARLRLSDEETSIFQEQLGRVLEYAEQLRAVDVTEAEAAAHAVPMFDVARTDEARNWFGAEDALHNAPRSASGLFVVPKVVE